MRVFGLGMGQERIKQRPNNGSDISKNFPGLGRFKGLGEKPPKKNLTPAELRRMRRAAACDASHGRRPRFRSTARRSFRKSGSYDWFSESARICRAFVNHREATLGAQPDRLPKGRNRPNADLRR